MERKEAMLDFEKTQAYAVRLKIVGILARRPAGQVEISAGLSLPNREVSNHLKFLEHVGVVHKNETVFELEKNGLETLARRQFEAKRSAHSPGPNSPETGRRSW